MLGIGGGCFCDFVDGEVKGLGHLRGDVCDGNVAVIGLDEQAVQGGGEQSGRVEAGAVGEIAACVQQGAGDMGVAPHAVDNEGDIVEACLAAGIEHVLGGPDVVHHHGFAQFMRQLQVTDEYQGLDIKGCSAEGVHAGLADGKHLGVAGAQFQQSEVGNGEFVHMFPWMKAHRVPLARLRVKAARVSRDQRGDGIRTMGVDVDDVDHGTGS